MIESFLDKYFFDNPIRDYLLSLLIFILGAILIFTFKRIVIKKFRKIVQRTESRIDDFILLQVERFIIPLLYLGILYFSVGILRIPSKIRQYIDSAAIAVFTFFIIRFLLLIINNSMKFFWKGRSDSSSDQASFKGISTFVSILVWALGVVFLLDNLGFRISAVITGLGIGGIAVALAAQAVLGDFFSYFVIFFDRPFEIGDFISVDDKSGTVEKIGIKTTRVTSLAGEQIVFPNSNLTNSRLHNFKRMQKRRVPFSLSVVYSTPASLLAEIPPLIKSIIQGIDNTTFERAHFQSYGESGLKFEIVYFVTTPDFNKFMDIQQTINFRVYEEFERRGIKMAYPSRTLYIENYSDKTDLKESNS